MKQKENTRFKMNAKTVKRAMVMSTLTLTLATASLPSIAYAADTIEKAVIDSSVGTENSFKEEKLPIPTEGIPVISPEQVKPEVSESEVQTVEEGDISTEETEVDSATTTELPVPKTKEITSRAIIDDEIAEVSTEVEFTDALANKISTIKLVRSITLSKAITIDKDVTIDLNGNLLNVGTYYISVAAEKVSINNGRLNGVGTNGTFYNANGAAKKTLRMNNIVFSGYSLSYRYYNNTYGPTFNFIFEGKNDIRATSNVVNNVVVEKNATLNMVGGGLHFSTGPEYGSFSVENAGVVNIDNVNYGIYSAKKIDIGENANFTVRTTYNAFYSNRIPLSISAKKGSTFNVESNPSKNASSTFGVGDYNFDFDHLTYLNMGGSYAQPVFAAGSTGNISIADSDLSVWTIKESATNGRPTNTWGIKDRFEISNFTDSSRLIYSNNPLVEKEFGQLKDYKRITNGATTARPVFSGVENKITIPVGTAFNPTDGITATDRIDGDITDKIEYSIADDKTIDTSQPGSYTINYTVKNSNGIVANATTELVVEEKKIAQTTISEVDTASTSVTGTGEANGTVEIKSNQQVIATGTVGSDGNYAIEIPKQRVGMTVKAIVKVNNQTSEASTVVKNGELVSTTISAIDSLTTFVSGTGEPNGDVTLFSDGTKLTSGRIGSDGKYGFTIAKQPAGTTVMAKVSLNGKESQTSTVVTKAPEAPEELATPVINDYYTTNTNVTGTIAGSAKQVAIYVNGVKKRTAAVTNGNFVIYTGDLGLTVAGQIFQVAGLLDGNEGPKANATVQARNQLIAPTINDYYTTNANVSGTITGSARQVAIFVNGVQKRTAAVNNGKYVIYTGDLGLNTVGKVFQVAGIDGIMVGPKAEGVVKSKDQLVAPTINDYYTTNVNVSGTIGGNAEKVAIFVDGVQKRIAVVNNGKYVIYTSDLGLTTAGKTFQIAGILGSTIGPKTEMVVKQKGELVAPQINDYYTTDVSASGTIGGSAEKVAVFVNGVQKRIAAVNDGKYTIYTSDLGLTTAGKTFQIAGISGSTIGPKTEMTVKQRGQLAVPNVADYYTTDVNASGTISESAEKIAVFVDGVQKRTTAVIDGKFTIYTGDLGLTAAGKTFQIAGMNGSVVGIKAEITVLAKP